MKFMNKVLCTAGVFLLAHSAVAQLGRGGPEWTTGNSDVQRDSWIKSDSYISVDSMSKPGFAYLWKQKLDARPTAKLSQAVMLQLLPRATGSTRWTMTWEDFTGIANSKWLAAPVAALPRR
jgi:hypothetical protein